MIRLSSLIGVRRDCAPFLHLEKKTATIASLLLGWATIAFPLTISLSTHAAELQEIRERGYLIVAVKDNVRPLGFRNEAGELAGLEIDIARRLAEELLGRSDAVVLQPVSNPERLTTVLEGETDLAIAHLTVTGSRARIVDFSTPYYINGAALITQNPAVQQLSDLRNQSIAVLNGSDTIAVVRSLLPTARLVGVESYQEALNLLEANQAIAFAGDASILTGWTQEYANYRLLPTLLSAEALAIALPRGIQYDDLRRQVNAAIDRWQEQGWLQERIRYWGLPESQSPIPQSPIP